MAVYNIDLIEPLQGKDVGLILGIPHEAVALGTGNGADKSFVIGDAYLPVFDKDGSGPPVDKDDVVVYVGGTASTDFTLTEGTPGEGYDTITFGAAPADKAVLTLDIIEEREPYIAQALKVDAKYDETTYGRLRSSLKKKQYGAKEVTISLDLLFADLEFMGLFFDDTTGEMIDEPPIVYGYIPMVDANEEIGRMYFRQCRMVPSSLIDVKEGDQASYALEISVDQDPILWKNTP